MPGRTAVWRILCKNTTVEKSATIGLQQCTAHRLAKPDTALSLGETRNEISLYLETRRLLVANIKMTLKKKI